MARNRPQRASGQTTSYGVPQNQIGVTASGVDTFVQPGLENAPAAPIQAAQPVAPDDQGIKDQLALAKSFNMLSGSAAQLGEADASGYGKMEEFGAEMVELQKQMESTGLVFADEVKQGTLDAMQHPAALLGQANAMSTNAASAYYDRMNAEKDDYRANNPDALNMDLTMARWDAGIQGIDTPLIGRADVFDRNLIVAQSSLRQGYETNHREWLSKRVLNESKLALQEQVGSILDTAVAFKLDPAMQSGFNMNQYPGSTIGPIIAPTEQETFDAALAEASASITKLLDDGRGGLHVPNDMHELIGFALVDIAANEDNPYASEMAEALLLDALTGPKNARTKLWEVGSVNKYYRDHKDTIAAHQTKRKGVLAKTTLTNQVRVIKDGLISLILKNKVAGQGTVTNESQVIGAFNLLSGMPLPDGVTVKRDKDSAVFSIRNPETGVITDVPLNINDAVDQANHLYLQRQRESHTNAIEAEDENGVSQASIMRENGLSEAEILALAHTRASAETNMVSPHTQQIMTNTYELMNKYRARAERDTNPEDIGLSEEAFRESLTSYGVLREQSTAFLKKHIPNEDERMFFEVAHLMMTDPTLAEYLGGDRSRVYNTMLGLSGVGGTRTLEGFSEAWNDYGRPAVIDFANDGYADPAHAEYTIGAVAKTLFIGGVVPDIADAVDFAQEIYFKDTIDLGGMQVKGSNIDQNLLNVGVIDPDTGELMTVEEQHIVRDFFRNLATKHDWSATGGPAIGADDVSGIGSESPVDMDDPHIDSIADFDAWLANTTAVPGVLNAMWEDFVSGGWFGSQTDRDAKRIDEMYTYVRNRQYETYLESRDYTRTLTLDDVLNKSRHILKVYPPDDFIADTMLVGGIEEYRWRVVPDSNGYEYDLLVVGENGVPRITGNPENNGRPFTLNQIIRLSKRVVPSKPDPDAKERIDRIAMIDYAREMQNPELGHRLTTVEFTNKSAVMDDILEARTMEYGVNEYQEYLRKGGKDLFAGAKDVSEYPTSQEQIDTIQEGYDPLEDAMGLFSPDAPPPESTEAVGYDYGELTEKTAREHLISGFRALRFLSEDNKRNTTEFETINDHVFELLGRLEDLTGEEYYRGQDVKRPRGAY